MRQVAMRQLFLFVTLIAVCGFIGVQGSSAGVITTLGPVSDRSAEDGNLDGVFETLFPEADVFLSVSLEAPPAPPLFGYDGEHRAAMEFDISSIPAGGTILSASLFLPRTSTGISPSGASLGTLIHGYAGDGAVGIADMLVDNLIVDIGGGLEADVQSFIQGLVNGGTPYGGFTVRSSPGYFQRYRSSESIAGGSELTIEYVPEPATMLVLGLGLVPALLGRARRR